MQWLLDSMTAPRRSSRNGRLDVAGHQPAGPRPALADVRPTRRRGRPNFARYNFLDPRARDFYPDWDGAADITVALLRTEAGRNPHDKRLRELVGELSTCSDEFRTRWAAHNVRIHHGGIKPFHHPVVGDLELAYQTLDCPSPTGRAHLTVYTAEPGSPSEDRLKLLASWAATHDPTNTSA